MKSVVAAALLLVPCLLVTAVVSTAATASERPTVLIAVGAEGTPEYGVQFRQWAGRWQAAARRGHADVVTVGLDAPGEASDREQFRQHLAKASAAKSPLWIVLIGHGTYDGKTAKFNLRCDDFTPADLSGWLKDVERPLAVIDCTSCSGPFLGELSAKNRVVVTATKSGHESNFARFGEYLSSAIVDPAADLDKDEQTSLLEAFLVASSGVREFYARESRLATEHALLDDNGDRLGTPADWFTGLRPTKAAKDGASLDGALARQFVLIPSGREDRLPDEVRKRRDDLERQLADLRSQKAELEEFVYFDELEFLLLQIANLYPPEPRQE